MYERFTDRARKVMSLANSAAQWGPDRERGSPDVWVKQVSRIHLVYGILEEGKGVACNVLKNLLDGSTQSVLESLRQAVLARIDVRAQQADRSIKLPLSPAVGNVVARAMVEARDLGHNYVGTEHLMLGLLHEPGGVELMESLGVKVTHDRFKAEVVNLLGQREGQGQAQPGEKPPEDAALKSTAALVQEGVAAAAEKLRERIQKKLESLPRIPQQPVSTRVYSAQPSRTDLIVRFTEALVQSQGAEACRRPAETAALAAALADEVLKAIKTETHVWHVDIGMTEVMGCDFGEAGGDKTAATVVDPTVPAGTAGSSGVDQVVS